MGAMIFGGVAQDRIQFNHKTLWKGTAGKTDLGSYLTFGDIYVINKAAQEAKSYRRALSLSEGVSSVRYVSNNVTYNREYLASYPDKVIAIRYTASSGQPLHVALQLINGQGGERAAYTPNGATFKGQVANGMHFRASLAVEQTGGEITVSKDEIEIKGASEFTLFLTCGTDFDPLQATHLSGDSAALHKQLADYLQAAKEKGYEAVRADHVKDYQSLFARTKFHLQGAQNLQTTDLLLQDTRKEMQKMVDLLVFQYGRYLAISSSRGVSLPSNLQGIWCKDGTPSSSAVWASDIHSNVNVQMNYWPVESTNLSELHLPFLEYIRNEATREGGTWQQNARDLGAQHGWVVNTAGNIFGGSSNYKLGKYSVANAWYCQHLWQHFAFTRDTTYLKTFALPLMKSTCEFWFDRLVEAQNGDGTLECPNEYSPEQGKVQNATAHAQQLVTELFQNTAEAIRVLGDESGCAAAFQQNLKEKAARLDAGLRVDANGQLKEWKYQENTPNISAGQNYFADDESNVWQGHRHPSHLMGLYPGFAIDKGLDSTLWDAALVSLKDRGDETTGWGRAFRLCLWARARDSEKAYETLRGFAHRTTSLSYDWKGGFYDNLLDAHATSTFQIEGNFGATAGIAEMLLQSRPDSLVLLPALPTAWSEGDIAGLKAIGNFEVSLAWKDGKLRTLKITSLSGMPVTLAYPALEKASAQTEAGERIENTATEPNRYAFPTEKGMTYLLTLPKEASAIVQAKAEASPFNFCLVNRRLHLEPQPFSLRNFDLQGRQLPHSAALGARVYIVQADHLTKQILVP